MNKEEMFAEIDRINEKASELTDYIIDEREIYNNQQSAALFTFISANLMSMCLDLLENKDQRLDFLKHVCDMAIYKQEGLNQLLGDEHGN